MAGEQDIEVPGDEIVVELDGGTPQPEPAPKATEAKTAESPKPVEGENVASKALQEAMDTHKRRAEAAEATAAAERNRAEQSERRRQAQEAQLQEAQEKLQSGEMARVTQGIESATRELASLQAEARSALEAGNFEKAAEISTKQARAAAQLDRWEAAKERLESEAARPDGGRVVDETREAPALTMSNFERYVSGFSDPRAQTWLRAHPECVPPEAGGNPQKNAQMMAGHYAALAQNLTPNTEDYFRVIEEHTGHRKPVTQQEEEPKLVSKQTVQRQAAPSAPVSRTPPSGQGTGGTRTVRLSPAEQEMAKISFPHLKTDRERFAEYAKNKLDLEAEGKLGRTSH